MTRSAVAPRIHQSAEPAPDQTIWPKILRRVDHVSGRTFLLRQHYAGRFPFEVCQELAGGRLIQSESYRLESLAMIDLERRIRESAAHPVSRSFVPFVTATGYVHDDDERGDRLREARRDEQAMLGGEL